MNKAKRRTSLILIMTFVLALIPLFGGCDALLEGNEEIRPMAEDYIDALIANNFAAAEELCPEFDSVEHKKYFDLFRASFEGTAEYEIKQVGWNTNVTNGVAYKRATYEIITDDGKTVYFEFSTQDGVSGLSNVNHNDSTDFIESTKSLWVVDLILKAVSLAIVVFTIFMIVDCAKRAIPKKALYIILILVSVIPSITVGSSALNFGFHVGFIFSMSSLDTTAINESIKLAISIPVGALIYFFRRKHFPLKKDLAAQESAEAVEQPEIAVPEVQSENSPKDNGGNTES